MVAFLGPVRSIPLGKHWLAGLSTGDSRASRLLHRDPTTLAVRPRDGWAKVEKPVEEREAQGSLRSAFCRTLLRFRQGRCGEPQPERDCPRRE